MDRRDSPRWREDNARIGSGLSAVIEWSSLVVDHGSGSRIWDESGVGYLDFNGGAGVNSVGHSNKVVLDRVHAQIDKIMIGAHASAARIALLTTLLAETPIRDGQAQFFSGGSEAVEAALRLARSVTGKSTMLAFEGAYHGRTRGSAALVSGDGGASTVVRAPYADCSRCPFHLTHPRCGFACVRHAEDMVDAAEGGGLAAVVVEPVQGRSGNVVPPQGYLERLRLLAVRYGALLVVDESMTGFGRTGRMFCSETTTADVIVLGKGMGAGYPISAVVAGRDLMSAGDFGRPSAASSSYGGFPAACAAGSAVLDVIRQDGLVDRSRLLGHEFLASLRSRLAELSVVREVRGAGLAIGVELVAGQALREVFDRLVEAGLLVMVGGHSLRLYPPLTVREDELAEAETVLFEVLSTFG